MNESRWEDEQLIRQTKPIPYTLPYGGALLCFLLLTVTPGVVVPAFSDSVLQILTPDITTNELAGGLFIQIIRSETNADCSVLCQTVDGTAIAGIHYSNLAQTVSFAAGQGTNTVTIKLLDDTLPGPDTSFTLLLTNPVNSQIGARSNLTVTIFDNDALGHPAFGINGVVNAVTATADGAVIVGGGFPSINGVAREGVAKVGADESLDSSFYLGQGAHAGALALFVQANGEIVYSGSFTALEGVSRQGLVRLNADGSLDDSFDSGTGPNSVITALAPAADGSVFAGGFFTAYGGVLRLGVAKINPDGSLNTNFVPQISCPLGQLYVLSVAAQTGGGLLVGADSAQANTNICFRLNSDGSRDTGFTNRFNDPFRCLINSMVVQPDGKILVAGSFSTVNGVGRKNIARLNANGSLDTTFDPSSGANFTIFKLLLLDNGQIVAVGPFAMYAGSFRRGIVRINSNGSLDQTFNAGAGADAFIYDVAPLPGNRLAVGGAFRHFAGFLRCGLAVLNPSGQLVTRTRFESFAAAGDLEFGILLEPEVPFRLLSSSNLTDWQLVYTNLVHQSFTNLALPMTAQDRLFYRTVQGR